MPNCTRLAFLFTILSRVFFYYFNRTFSIRLFDTVVALQNTWIDVLASSFDYNTIWFRCSSTSSSSSYFLFAWDWYCCGYRAYSRGTMIYPKKGHNNKRTRNTSDVYLYVNALICIKIGSCVSQIHIENVNKEKNCMQIYLYQSELLLWHTNIMSSPVQSNLMFNVELMLFSIEFIQRISVSGYSSVFLRYGNCISIKM